MDDAETVAGIGGGRRNGKEKNLEQMLKDGEKRHTRENKDHCVSVLAGGPNVSKSPEGEFGGGGGAQIATNGNHRDDCPSHIVHGKKGRGSNSS